MEMLPPKVSLYDLLANARQADECLLDLDLDEMRELGSQMKDKVDGYKFVVDRLVFRIEEIRSQIGELVDLKHQMENKLEAVKSRMAEVMKANGFDRLQGDKWSVRVGHSKSVIVDDYVKADAALASAVPGAVKIQYAIDKTGIRKLLESGESLQWAKIEQNPFVVFSAKKE